MFASRAFAKRVITVGRSRLQGMAPIAGSSRFFSSDAATFDVDGSFEVGSGMHVVYVCLSILSGIWAELFYILYISWMQKLSWLKNNIMGSF
jgi:hypothetical protein